jgi:vacuolar-type H+-ATPase subunit I/STV1
VTEEIKLLRAIHGSARANGGDAFGRISFRLSKSPEQRWRELFDAGKGEGVSTEERGAEFMVHAEVKPGEVASTRDKLLALIADVNDKRRGELVAQAEKARERTDNRRSIEDALNRELEALKFE